MIEKMHFKVTFQFKRKRAVGILAFVLPSTTSALFIQSAGIETSLVTSGI